MPAPPPAPQDFLSFPLWVSLVLIKYYSESGYVLLESFLGVIHDLQVSDLLTRQIRELSTELIAALGSSQVVGLTGREPLRLCPHSSADWRSLDTRAQAS